MELIDSIKDKIDSLLKENNYELIDISYKRKSGEMVLRILVDRLGGGISVGECSKINEMIGAMLDESNVMSESYILEVSSPGLDRPLLTDRDYKRALGRLVRVNTTKPIDGKYLNIGKLIKVEPERIVLEKDGIESEIPREYISKAILEIVF